MLLPLLVSSSPPLDSTLLLAVTVPGPQPQDLFYIGGVLAVGAFGARQVFDSIFAESTDEYQPPLPGSLPGPLKDIPFIGNRQTQDPAEAAESLRQQLLTAADAGDLKLALKLEKDLKNLLAETGVRMIVEDDGDYSPEKQERLPKNW